MKKLNIARLLVLLPLAVIFSFAACDDKGFALENDSITLTIGASEKLVPTGNFADGIITWSSSDSSVVSVDQDGTVTALKFTNPSSGTGNAVIMAKSGNNTENFKITTTMKGQVDIMNLTPLKDHFSDYFMMGNIFNPGDVSGTTVTNTKLTRHYNVLTAENHMKPSNIASIKGSYNWTTADSMVNAAIASGFKVVGHTLLWHSQNASWMNSTASPVTLEDMKNYITAVVDHFKERIYSWDVLNEAFPDSGYTNDWKTSMRSNNPWFREIGSDFVYEGFLTARLADPDAILYYNDYNLDNSGKATMVRNMVRDVNQRYADSGDRPAGEAATRLLIEGIGMQSHHNTNVQASSIRNSLNLFRPLGVKISISELDVLGQGYSSSIDTGPNQHGSSPVTNDGLFTQARLYGEYFRVFLDNADIIERVTFWGLTDNLSWRSKGLPLLFDPNGKAKPAYYKVIGALGK